jgi:uncharacterized short protein YbdD (DUF466 family)
VLEKIRIIGKGLAQAARLMVGVRDYEAYLRHQRERHSSAPVMSREEFVRACQNSRYSGKGTVARCPC